MIKVKHNMPLLHYLFRFLGIFCLLFYGTETIIGLSSPENNYSPFVARYLDYIGPYCRFLLLATRGLVSLAGFETVLKENYVVAVRGGTGIRLGFDCIGYGVLSFWIAFVVANRGRVQKKLLWAAAGLALLCAANVLRLSLVLIANNRGWPAPLGWDHHTWFNIASYLFIFGMMWRFDRSHEKQGTAVLLRKGLPAGEENKRPVSLQATAAGVNRILKTIHTIPHDRTRN